MWRKKKKNMSEGMSVKNKEKNKKKVNCKKWQKKWMKNEGQWKIKNEKKMKEMNKN